MALYSNQRTKIKPITWALGEAAIKHFSEILFSSLLNTSSKFDFCKNGILMTLMISLITFLNKKSHIRWMVCVVRILTV